MYRVLLIILGLFLLFTPRPVFAEKNSFVTIVNPQRISTYTKDYLGSFQAEVHEAESRNLPATWPVTYDVLAKKDFVNALKKLDINQELGIFLEITPLLARNSSVNYNKTDSWHRATSLFLSGYTQANRKKLINTVFKKFKEDFGYYPKSVGSWWTDSFSLSYMQKKYGITSTLNVSDQYDLDGYQVWGTWWSVPYYPNKINAAEPAQSKKDKLNVVTLRWASRDPLNGYISPSKFPASMYSLQDYQTIGIDPSYFDRLMQTFALRQPQNRFGQATVGLEGDMGAQAYKGTFAAQMDVVKNLEKNSGVKVLTMKQFSSWYMSQFPNLSPNHIIQSNDPLGQTDKKVVWMQTPFYRIGLVYDAGTKKTRIIDFRAYQNNFIEPFYLEPNKQLNLSINLPYQIDTVIDPSSTVELGLGALKNIATGSLTFEKGSIDFETKNIIIPNKSIHIPNTFPVPASGILIKDYSLTIPFTLKRRFPFLPSSIPFFISETYSISQTEYNALMVLKKLKMGKVLVYDKDCLKCVFVSQYKPAAAAGKKSYVAKFSGKPTDIDLSFLLSKTSSAARKILKDQEIKYVYLAKYENYVESLPYLPQDLGLKRVYENANATIWEVK